MAYLDIHSEEKQSYRLPFDRKCTIGRIPENDVCIQEERVSRSHALIRLRGEYYVIEDLGSKNGVEVNGVPVESFKPHPLYDGDVITISKTTIVFISEGRQPSQLRPSLPVTSNVAEASVDMMDGISVILAREEPVLSGHATIDVSTDLMDIVKADTEEGMRAALKRFQAMVRIANVLGNILNIEDLLDKIMASIFDIFPQADRSFIMLRTGKEGVMKPAAGRRRKAVIQQEGYEVSQTIINRVITNKQSILSSNASQDDRFTGGQSIVDYSIRSLMYVPFVANEEILGIITVDTMSIAHVFTTDDLAMLTGIAAQAAVAIKNVQLYKDIQRETQSRTQLSRYLSPDIVDGILRGTIPLRLGGEQKYGTVLFSDIVGFTRMAESMTAVEVIDKLNRYFMLVTAVVTRNKGTLHKFEGDMVMAFWNVMVEDSQAEYNAVRTGLEMQIAVWKLACAFEAEGHLPVHVGVGCNSGAFAGGNIGGADKMEYTVIGDSINVAKRVESLSGTWQVFVAERTYSSVKNRCVAVALPPAIVKGKTQPLKIFSIRGLQIAERELLMCIPVTVSDQSGAAGENGLIVGACWDTVGLTLVVLTRQCPRVSELLILRSDCIEFSAPFEYTGNVVTAEKATYEKTSLCYKISIAPVHASDEALLYCKGSFLTTTDKPWDAIKRG